MNLYLAGSFPYGGEMYMQAVPPAETNLLQSIVYLDDDFKKRAREFKNFMLDSGAFSFLTQIKNGKVDWQEYIRRYADIINETGCNLYMELDVDALVGLDKVKRFRATLERLTNKPAIPVWHLSRGKEEFIRMCDEYKYVALGGIVIKEIKPADYKYFTWFINQAHKRGAKIHGLGFTRLKLLDKYRFDSVDSSAWASGVRFGQGYKFTGKDLIKINKPAGAKVKPREMAVYNYKEWVKFSKYAELHY